jgi:ataxin-3
LLSLRRLTTNTIDDASHLTTTETSSKEYLERVAEGSGNVDPSGNFSIEVLRAAMQSEYNLALPNVRQDGVLAGIDVTDCDGFICHKDAHWFAIRKINGRFWNLNSMADRPSIISHFNLATEIAGFQKSGCKLFRLQSTDLVRSRFWFWGEWS